MTLRLPVSLLFLLCLATSWASASDPQALLVSAEQLAQRAAGEPLVVLDVRSQQDYKAGHIPDALWVDLSAWKQHTLRPDGLADRAYWSNQVGNLGITTGSSVVVYGGSPTSATLLWWTLKYLGVKQVRLLDGGFDAWVDEGAPLSRELVQAEAVRFEPQFQPDRIATLDDVQAILKDKSATIIDTRSAAEHTGTGGPGARKGRIPGALHQEWTNFVTDDGRFKPVAEIRKLLEAEGLTPQTKVVTHCQTGGRASLNAFAMELAGYGPVKNYYCGWSEWSAAEDTPVE